MRTRVEIDRALWQLLDAFQVATIIGDQRHMDTLSSTIMALRWVNGSNEPGGFGEMLALMEAADVADQLIERHSVN